jgi:RNA polymerase sigma factor (sigma-70 family)
MSIKSKTLHKSSLIPSSKTDLALVKSVRKHGDNESFNEICRRYENVFYKICQKYVTPLQVSGINPQDIFDEKNFIILHCVNTYKSGKKTKLSTWIGNYARYLCLNSINARRFILPSSDDDIKRHIEESQTAQNYTQSHSTEEDYKYIVNILEQLRDERINEIFRLRYFSEKKMIWAKIACKMGISTQTAINLHNRGIELLRRKIKSDNISDVI